MELPDKFRLLYNCKLKDTGHRRQYEPIIVYKDLGLNERTCTVSLEEEKIIAIEMPESEYERFVKNWNQYMTLMLISQSNASVKDQFEKLMTIATLYK
jgi:hypothetical protein